MGVETALMAGGGALSVLGSISSGQDAKKWGKYQNKQAKADASATLGAARVEQRKIRESAAQQRSICVISVFKLQLPIYYYYY